MQGTFELNDDCHSPTHFLGVDVSKLTLDCILVDSKGHTLLSKQYKNTHAGCIALLKKANKLVDRANGTLLVCCEHTGIYSTHLVVASRGLDIECWRADAYTISQSHGIIVRRKDDRYDAFMIASYANRFHDLRPRQSKVSNRKLNGCRTASARVNLLLAHRELIVKAKVGMQAQLKEQQAFDLGPDLAGGDDKLIAEAIQAIEKLIDTLKERIKYFDQLIERALEDEAIVASVKIARSCPGAGVQIIAKLVVITEGFTRILDARKLACYGGIAPFVRTSGTSLRGKSRVSNKGDRALKKALHLAAMSAVRKQGAFHEYYQNRLTRGKEKMVALNAVRNKILHTIIACVRKNVTYDENYAHPLAEGLHTS